MKKTLSLLTLITTLTTGAIGIGSCGFGNRRVSNSDQSVNSKIMNEKNKEYITYNIDLDYEEIFYTPTFEIKNEEGEWQPYVNKKYDNKLFFYSPSTSISHTKEIHYDGDGHYHPSYGIEEIDLFQSIVNSVRIHEIYLKNKELFNTFDFENKNKSIYDLILYPITGKFTDLEGDITKGDYHLNIHNNDLNCTINAKTKYGNFNSSPVVSIFGNFSGPNRIKNWNFSTNTEECKWFSDDLKERFILPRSEEIEFMILNNKIETLAGDISLFKKILNKESLKIKTEEDGAIYDEWFKGTNRERIIEKDFWTTLDKPYDTDIFSPQETVNPRNIVYSKHNAISFNYIYDTIIIDKLCTINKELCLLKFTVPSIETFEKLFNISLIYKNIYESFNSFNENYEDRNSLNLSVDTLKELILSTIKDFTSGKLLNDFEESLKNGDDLQKFITKILNSHKYNETYKVLFKSLFYKNNNKLTSSGIYIQNLMVSQKSIMEKMHLFNDNLKAIQREIGNLFKPIHSWEDLSSSENVIKAIVNGYDYTRDDIDTLISYLKNFIAEYFPDSNDNEIVTILNMVSIISNIANLSEQLWNKNVTFYEIQIWGKWVFDFMNSIDLMPGTTKYFKLQNYLKLIKEYSDLKSTLNHSDKKLILETFDI